MRPSGYQADRLNFHFVDSVSRCRTHLFSSALSDPAFYTPVIVADVRKMQGGRRATRVQSRQ